MIVAPLLLGVAESLGWRTGAFGVVLTALAVLACPVSMGLMMWQMSRHSEAKSHNAEASRKVSAVELPPAPESNAASLTSKTP